MKSASYMEHSLLSSLNKQSRPLIEADISVVDLAVDEVLFEANQPLDRIWFVCGGLLSMVTVLDHGREVDGITVGRGGALGLPAALGSRTAISRAAVIVAGEAWRLPGEACRRAMEVDPHFSHRLMRYYEAVFATATRNAACKAAHALELRFCRFLLTCRDQLATDELPLRQEFVSRMLGVNRTSVTPISRALQADGAITVRHGLIHIRSVDRLKRRACECYAVTKARFQALS